MGGGAVAAGAGAASPPPPAGPGGGVRQPHDLAPFFVLHLLFVFTRVYKSSLFCSIS